MTLSGYWVGAWLDFTAMRVCHANVKELLKSRGVKEFCKGAIIVENHNVLPGWGDNMKTRPGCIVVNEEGSVD